MKPITTNVSHRIIRLTLPGKKPKIRDLTPNEAEIVRRKGLNPTEHQMVYIFVVTRAVAAEIQTRIDADEQELNEYLARPDVRDRQEISDLYEEADHPRWFNHSRTLRAEADRKLAAWRNTYPKATREEHQISLIKWAEQDERLAAIAMMYDWISLEGKKKRRDKFLARAAKLRKEAEQLRKVE